MLPSEAYQMLADMMAAQGMGPEAWEDAKRATKWWLEVQAKVSAEWEAATAVDEEATP